LKKINSIAISYMELLIREHLVLSLEKNTVEEWEKTYEVNWTMGLRI